MIHNAIKMLAVVVIAILVISLTLVALGIITWRLFWVVAIAAAIIAYYVIPKLKKSMESGS